MASYKEIYLYQYESNHLTSMQQVLDKLVTPLINMDNSFINHADIVIEDSNKQASHINFYDTNNNVQIVFHNTGTGITINSGLINNKPAQYVITAYNEIGSVAQMITASTNGGSNKICGWQMMYGYICKNGIIINGRCYSGSAANSNLNTMTSYPMMWIMITRNQNNIPVVIMMCYQNIDGTTIDALEEQQSVVRSYVQNEFTGCWTDASPIPTFGKAFPATRNQSVLVPFFTNSQVGQISYTPFAGRFIAGNNSSFIYDFRMHLIEFNDKQYLTNGVWAIEV